MDHQPDTMYGSSRHGTAAGFAAMLCAVLLAPRAARGVLTDHLLVQLREDAQDEAHQLAAQHGFQSARKVKGVCGVGGGGRLGTTAGRTAT